jgi:seryl-tRNA(Sec) selenium transferase
MITIAAMALTGLTFLTPSYATTSGTPTAGTPTVAPQYVSVTFSTEQVAVLKRALELAAQTCQTQQDGCVVGLNRNALVQALDAGKAQEKEVK